MNIQQLLESSNQFKSVQDDAKRLQTKWTKSGLLEGINDANSRSTMAMLLENQAKQLIVEASSTGNQTGGAGAYNGESWSGVALPLVRRVFGEIAAKEFVSVQPMNLPSGLVFYLDFKYGTGVKPFQSGGSLYGANASTNVTDITSQSLYGAGKFGYSINQFSASIAATTGSTSWATFNLDADYSSSFPTYKVINVPLPTSADQNGVRAFVFTSGSITGTEILQAFTTVTSNTASFVVTGSLVTNTTGASAGTVVLYYDVQPTATSRGDFEDASGAGYPNAQSATTIAIPEINVQLKSEAIVAKTRKLKAQWTPEFAQDLNAYHSVDAESEVTSMISNYIAMEVDLELLGMLIENAATTGYWSAANNTFWNGSGFTTVNTGATSGNLTGYYNSQGEWFQTIGTVLQKVSNTIHQKTLRGGANFMVVSPSIATVLETIPGFAADGDGEKSEFNFGIQKMGSLNSRYKVYKNPYLTSNVILMGYKGSQFLETGAVYAPYIPLIMTPLVYDPETFTPRKV